MGKLKQQELEVASPVHSQNQRARLARWLWRFERKGPPKGAALLDGVALLELVCLLEEVCQCGDRFWGLLCSRYHLVSQSAFCCLHIRT